MGMVRTGLGQLRSLEFHRHFLLAGHNASFDGAPPKMTEYVTTVGGERAIGYEILGCWECKYETIPRGTFLTANGFFLYHDSHYP